METHGVELIGASLVAILKAEDRELFRQAMERIGLKMARSASATDLETARRSAQEIGDPVIIRPAFTPGAPAAAWPTIPKS